MSETYHEKNHCAVEKSPLQHKGNIDKAPISLEPLNDRIRVFDSLVTRDYLHELSTCSVRPMQATGYSAVRWYRIDKIVMEKKVFFADKLSMLYMSLYKKSQKYYIDFEQAERWRYRTISWCKGFLWLKLCVG